jgi:hypothetical protein
LCYLDGFAGRFTPCLGGRSKALDAGFDRSQLLSVTCESCSGHRQQPSQVGLRDRVSFDLQDQAVEFGAVAPGDH